MADEQNWLAKNKRQLAWYILSSLYAPFTKDFWEYFWDTFSKPTDFFEFVVMGFIVSILIPSWISLTITITIIFPILFPIIRIIQRRKAKRNIIYALRGHIRNEE